LGEVLLVVRGVQKPVEGIAVLVEQAVAGSWNIAGPAVGAAAHVEATIGRKTNTPDEKARFLAEMRSLLRSVLGPALREETYIVLHEVDRQAYWRGGLTRAERDGRGALR